MASTRSAGLRAALEIAQASAQTWAIVFDKGRVLRRAVDLGIDPADHSAADYDAVARFLQVPPVLSQDEGWQCRLCDLV